MGPLSSLSIAEVSDLPILITLQALGMETRWETRWETRRFALGSADLSNAQLDSAAIRHLGH